MVEAPNGGLFFHAPGMVFGVFIMCRQANVSMCDYVPSGAN